MKRTHLYSVVCSLALTSGVAGCSMTAPTLSGPDIKLTRLDGSESSLAAYRKANTLLHLWATWCATCREELGSLNRIATEVTEIAVVAVAIEDDPEEVRRFVAGEDIAFPVLLDGGEARGAFSVPSVPYTILLGPSGKPRTFLDPESGERVSEVTSARYWGSTQAVERLRASATDDSLN